jgi:alpha-galactosidase
MIDMFHRNAIHIFITGLLMVTLQANASDKVRVFVLVGQSNMQGLGQADLGADYLGLGDDGKPVYGAAYAGGPGSLRYQAQTVNPEKYGKLLDDAGNWVTRDDVWVWTRNGQDLAGIDDDNDKNNDTRTGNLTTGFGAVPKGGQSQIGPEFGFGHAVGDAFDEQVALVKIAWGGKSLGYDFRPPTAREERPIDWKNFGNKGRDPAGAGVYYDLTLNNIKDALVDLAAQFPGKEIELTGFGWHQGVNDRSSEPLTREYEENMTDFINDMRSDLEAPDMRFVIGTTVTDPESVSYKGGILLQEQFNLADPELHPEFVDNVAVVDTRPFWRDQSLSPARDNFHWNQNGESYYLVGESMGEAMITLVPEPGSLTLLGLGGVLLTCRGLRGHGGH